MNYTEMLFALEVRKTARAKMTLDARDKLKNERKEKSHEEYDVLFKGIFNDLDYELYVKNVISDIEKTALIIKSN